MISQRQRSRGKSTSTIRPRLDSSSRERLDLWFCAAYEELRRLALAVKRDDINATISTSTLVHEAWIKLARSSALSPQSEGHFKSIAACAMRQIVRDAARKRCADKRGGEIAFVPLDDSMGLQVCSNEDFLRLETALEALEKISPRQSSLVVLRFFGGLSNAEIEVELDVSASVVERDWRAAKAWLAVEINKGA